MIVIQVQYETKFCTENYVQLCDKNKFEVFVLLGCCAAYDGISLPTFRDSVILPPSRFEQS